LRIQERAHVMQCAVQLLEVGFCLDLLESELSIKLLPPPTSQRTWQATRQSIM
jgi:hypothetical protein